MIQLPIPLFDVSILHWSQQVVGLNPALDVALHAVAEWSAYLVPVTLVGLWFWYRRSSSTSQESLSFDAAQGGSNTAKVSPSLVSRRVDLAELTLAGLGSWIVLSGLVKLFLYRPRPWVAGTGVKELFFHRPDNSFPSDHSALLFALATSAYLMGWRKSGHWLLLVAVLVSAARIATGIHWFTDIMGGLVIGVIGASLIYAVRAPLRRMILEPIVKTLSAWGL